MTSGRGWDDGSQNPGWSQRPALTSTHPRHLDDLSRGLHATARIPGMADGRQFVGRLGLQAESFHGAEPAYEPGVVLYRWAADPHELNANVYEGLAVLTLVESGFPPVARVVADFTARLAIPVYVLDAVALDQSYARALFPATLVHDRLQSQGRTNSQVFRVA